MPEAMSKVFTAACLAALYVLRLLIPVACSGDPCVGAVVAALAWTMAINAFQGRSGASAPVRAAMWIWVLGYCLVWLPAVYQYIRPGLGWQASRDRSIRRKLNMLTTGTLQTALCGLFATVPAAAFILAVNAE